MGFLFDLDGVLVDTHAIVIAGWQQFAAVRGRAITEKEIVEWMFGRRTYDILVDFFALEPGEAADLVAAGVDDKRAEVAKGVALKAIAGAPQFVRATLRARIPCALVSSASTANIALALGAIGLADAFAVIVDHDHVQHGKPAPDPYLAAAEAIGVPAVACVVFEDTQPGIVSAHAAGARCVGVASLGRPEVIGGADIVIDDFRDLRPRDVLSRLDAASRHAAAPGARCRGRSTAAGEAERRS